MTDCTCIALRTAARKVSALYDEALAPLGVNIAQFSLLRRVARGTPVSLTELGRRCELDRSTVGRNARVLERMDLLRTVASSDQREAMLELTEEGRRILAEGAPLWDGVQRALDDRLGSDAARLRNLLAAI